MMGRRKERTGDGAFFLGFGGTDLPGALRDRRSPTAPSFVARRKIGEKGVPRGCGPLNPRGNVLGHSDVLCAYVFATVHLTRLSRAWRAPHCFHALCALRPDGDAKRHRRKCPWGTGAVKLVALLHPPTSDYKSGWLFFKFQQFLCITCSTTESVEAVRSTPRAGLNRVNCTRANS